jgi:hypothetical protein
MRKIKIESFGYDFIMMNLKNEKKTADKTRTEILVRMIKIVRFLFSTAVQDIMKEFDGEFRSKFGNLAYPRTMLLGIFLYAIDMGDYTLKDISKRCAFDDILKIFTCKLSPSYSTLRRFLEDKTKELAFKKIFIYTLVELNDLDLLKFLQVFIDGTDAIVKGSKHNKITRDQLKALKLLKKWNLLLKNKRMDINRWKRKLNNKKSTIKNKRELELIGIAENNPWIFTKAMAKRISFYEKAFKETKKNYISSTFPESVMMPTKKGGFDFAFNLQPILTENKIIIGILLHKKPNDYESIDEIMIELRINFQILEDMISKYGSRNNIKEIRNLLDKAIYVMDSGYFSNYNLEKIKELKMNAIIMPKTIAKLINKEFYKKNGIIKEEEIELTFKKGDFIRIINGYICPENKILKLTEIKDINSKKNREEMISEDYKEKEYVHICKACENCPHKKQCIGDEEYKIIKDRVSTLSYEATNKFLQKRHWIIYRKRYHVSEGINGYMKRKNGILLLLGSSEAGVTNEMNLRATVYNLFRTEKLKDTLY